MKEIYFLRHADASFMLRVEDEQRPLSVKGKVEASQVAFYAKNHLQPPDACYVSHAKRAQQTAEYFKDMWDMKENNYFLTSELYDFKGDKVKQFIYNLPAEWNRVLLVGHNLGISEVANYFGDKLVYALPTAGLVHIAFDKDDWQTLTKGSVKNVILPEELSNEADK